MNSAQLYEVGFADEAPPAFSVRTQALQLLPFGQRGKFVARCYRRLGRHGARVTFAFNVPSASIPVHR